MWAHSQILHRHTQEKEGTAGAAQDWQFVLLSCTVPDCNACSETTDAARGKQENVSHTNHCFLAFSSKGWANRLFMHNSLHITICISSSICFVLQYLPSSTPGLANPVPPLLPMAWHTWVPLVHLAPSMQADPRAQGLGLLSCQEGQLAIPGEGEQMTANLH